MSLTLEWSNEQEVRNPDAWIPLLEKLLQFAGETEGITAGEIALTFVDDETIQQLNRDYRGMDNPTDVLSFAMQEIGDEELEIMYGSDEDEPNDSPFAEPLGDIIISVPRAIEQSEEYGHSLEREIGFLFVHGFLHLIGYDHQNEHEEKIMFDKQELILQKAGLTR